ncbi:hypothetical protein LG52_12 [Geobacillus kaustophilus]|jgi:hypothetical protein|uniref:Uncharacterized protein n=1 Tax=Geobacillus kaustophilus TaxID=1462 RepID=A0A0D8BSL3_GEOKU|nr:hypothetical protein [Geobacillus kaustophilus]KJE26979.1 hypothetical protein LG52_12 [Geobacillus kaustophilus]
MKADEFVTLISSLNAKESKDKPFSLGVIDPAYSSGRPKVIFDGSTTVSSKTYPYLSSYTPRANDRVILANVGGTHVILGKIT